MVVVACFAVGTTADGQKKKPRTKLKKLTKVATPTNNKILEKFIRSVGTDIKGKDGRWTFVVDKREVIVITDERADRMRIMIPIAKADKLTAKQMKVLLEANFDRALDAKYAIQGGTVWGVFTHWLSPLSKFEFKSAARQVARLAATYGTTFSSTDVVFGGGP